MVCWAKIASYTYRTNQSIILEVKSKSFYGASLQLAYVFMHRTRFQDCPFFNRIYIYIYICFLNIAAILGLFLYVFLDFRLSFLLPNF